MSKWLWGHGDEDVCSCDALSIICLSNESNRTDPHSPHIKWQFVTIATDLNWTFFLLNYNEYDKQTFSLFRYYRNVRNDRATPAEIASYYQHYVSQMSLEQSFACGTTVTSVTRQPGSPDGSPPCWRVTGLQRREGEELAGTVDKTLISVSAHCFKIKRLPHSHLPLPSSF